MIRKYVIKHDGHTVEIAGKNAAEKAQRWAEKGATIKAEIIAEPGDTPPNLTKLDAESLEVLGSIAARKDWDRLLHQIRNEEQKQVPDQ